MLFLLVHLASSDFRVFNDKGEDIDNGGRPAKASLVDKPLGYVTGNDRLFVDIGKVGENAFGVVAP